MSKALAANSENASTRSYADQLILEKLSEVDAVLKLSEISDKLTNEGIGLAAVRSLMASNPDVFAFHERRWIPAARLISEGRPTAEIMRSVLSGFGSPETAELVVSEVARIKDCTPEEVSGAVWRLAESDANFLVNETGKIGLACWGFVATDESLERALALNGISTEQFEAAKKKLEDVDLASGDYASALKHSPISAKEIGAVAYSKLNSDDPRSPLVYDSRTVTSAILSVPGYVCTGGGTMLAESEGKALISAAVKMASKLVATIDVDDAAPLELKTEDLAKMVAKIVGSGGTVTATKLLEETFEILPGSRTFPDDMATVMDALKQDSKVIWVGGDRFRKAGDVPDYIKELPEPFLFVDSGVLNEENEPVDVELTDEGLNSSLRKLLQHPLALDVCDEEEQPALKTQPESIRLVLKSIHRELGTFPLAQLPAGWLDNEPEYQEIILHDNTGKELQVWLNTKARLMYGFIDWWLDQPIESGAVFTLTRTNQPNEFEFQYMDQPDPVVFISLQRMEELRALGAESEGKSTLSLLEAVMTHWPKGADFLTILAELNVARRTPRRLAASLLSSYQCFYQRSGSPVWHFDAKKVDQGFDKSKKKFVKK